MDTTHQRRHQGAWGRLSDIAYGLGGASSCAHALRCVQVNYSRFIHGLQQENIQVNRKVLSELAMYEPHSFQALVEQVRFMQSAALPA